MPFKYPSEKNKQSYFQQMLILVTKLITVCEIIGLFFLQGSRYLLLNVLYMVENQ